MGNFSLRGSHACRQLSFNSFIQQYLPSTYSVPRSMPGPGVREMKGELAHDLEERQTINTKCVKISVTMTGDWERDKITWGAEWQKERAMWGHGRRAPSRWKGKCKDPWAEMSLACLGKTGQEGQHDWLREQGGGKWLKFCQQAHIHETDKKQPFISINIFFQSA